MSNLDLEMLSIASHTTARNKAVAKLDITAGSRILTVECMSSVLLENQKGVRCDFCHCLAEKDKSLKKCSGCASYFYCGITCQRKQWTLHHQRICKRINNFTTSLGYQELQPHEKLDSILLSHLIAQVNPPLPSDAAVGDGMTPAFETLMSLLPGPVSDIRVPPIVWPGHTSPEMRAEIYSRFGNNNFTMHSHLSSFAHAVFPLASRLFNHSCLPNAATRYILRRDETPVMEVVALRDISKNEEVCITYIDPALTQTRQQIFSFTYGFYCSCASCQFLDKAGTIPEMPRRLEDRTKLENELKTFIWPGSDVVSTTGLPLPTAVRNFEDIPTALLPFFHESYTSTVAETFSEASHDGNYQTALESGLTLTAIYALIYPPNYPQIGYHLLEIAKTVWNKSTGVEESELNTSYSQVRSFLVAAQRVLDIFGSEGDEGGPLEEVEMLKSLLD